MSYLVLARKWRPQLFSELVGQPHVARTILNGLRQGRLAHAYLFSGPRGVGKTTTARLLARAINCRSPQDGEPCGVCPACLAIAEGRSIDTIEIDAASNRGIDEIRQLRDGVRYAPIEGRAKVYIIDEVHMLTPEAFNALLKTLEEPPSHAYFCLATTAAQKVPQTIISRCQRFDFRRVSAAEIRGHLEKILAAEAIEFDAGALDIIARKADGSVRDSLSILDQVIAYSGGKALKQDALDVAGEVRLDLFFQAVELVATGNHAAALVLDAELAALGTDPQDFIVGLEAHLMLIMQAKALGVEKLDAPVEFKPAFAAAAGKLGDEDIVRLLQYATAAETDVRRNFNPRLRLQLLLLKFAAFERSVLIAELLKDLEADRGGRTAKSSPPPSNPRPAEPLRQTLPTTNSARSNTAAASTPPTLPPILPSTPPSDPLAAAQAAWDDICERIAKDHNSRGRMIKYGGYPATFNNGVLRVNFSKQVHLDTARGCLDNLRRELQAVIGEATIDLQLGEVPDRSGGAVTEDDPAVKMLQERLDARLIN